MRILNSEQKIGFTPFDQINFDKNSIGLNSFSKKPLSEKSTTTTTKSITKKTIVMEDTNNEDLAFTPETKKQKPAYLKYAAVGVLAIGLVAASYFLGNQYLTDERLKSTELAQEKIKTKVQEASFDLGEIAALELNVIAKDVEDESVSEIVAGDFFSVIAGSFREESNALKMLDKLKEEGFDEATLAKQSPDGLYRVAYGRFETKRKAMQLYYFLTQTLEEEAWYLAE